MNYCCFKTLIIFVFLCFQLLFSAPIFAAKLQRHKNLSNDSFILDKNDTINEQQLQSDNLLADVSVQGIPDGNDIRLSGYGFINLTLTFGTLQFEVCDSCKGTSRVCFDTAAIGIDRPLKCPEFSSYCRFEIKYDTLNGEERINFGDTPVYKSEFQNSCLQPTIKGGLVPAIGIIKFVSCEPKIDGIDKMIKLYVKIDSTCPIKVKNAKNYVPEVSTTNPSSNSTSSDPSSTASVPIWAIVIMVLGGIAVIIIIGGFVYYIFKKRQSARIIPQQTDAAKTTVSNVKVATIENSSKRKYDLNFTKFEPVKKSKKSQNKKNKKTIQEPSKEPTEDAPAPYVTLPPTPATAAPATPAPYVPYAKIPRIFPRSLKSAKTDSLDETTKKDKLAMIESAPVSLHHYCIKPANSDLLDQMNENYPEVDHDVMKGEVNLLCSPVSKMFASTNEMTREYEQKLTAAGCDFDEFGRILSMTDGARRFLQDQLTPATIVYFAFGAEYHQYLTDDVTILSKLSIPLLMVIAFQPRFADSNRKKACALLRRKLPTILGNFTAVQRKAMVFPMNIVEDAYCREPKYFNNIAGIKTDSENEEGKNKMEQEIEKKEVKNGEKKRKKKSSKKRH